MGRVVAVPRVRRDARPSEGRAPLAPRSPSHEPEDVSRNPRTSRSASTPPSRESPPGRPPPLTRSRRRSARQAARRRSSTTSSSSSTSTTCRANPEPPRPPPPHSSGAPHQWRREPRRRARLREPPWLSGALVTRGRGRTAALRGIAERPPNRPVRRTSAARSTSAALGRRPREPARIRGHVERAAL